MILIRPQPVLSHIEPFKPTRKATTGSKYIDRFVKIVPLRKRRVLATPESKIDLSFPPPPQPTLVYPPARHDDKGKLLTIDKKAYYNGNHLEALELACLCYQRRIIGIFAFPEAYENIERLFNDECDYIAHCLLWAYYKLAMFSFKDTAFRKYHKFGMYIIVRTTYRLKSILTLVYRFTNLVLSLGMLQKLRLGRLC